MSQVRFQPADLCDRKCNGFSVVVTLFHVALQVDIEEFED